MSVEWAHHSEHVGLRVEMDIGPRQLMVSTQSRAEAQRPDRVSATLLKKRNLNLVSEEETNTEIHTLQQQKFLKSSQLVYLLPLFEHLLSTQFACMWLTLHCLHILHLTTAMFFFWSPPLHGGFLGPEANSMIFSARNCMAARARAGHYPLMIYFLWHPQISPGLAWV